MHLTITLLGLLASTILAAQAPTSNQDHVLYLPVANSDNNALAILQDRCDWDAYCLPAYQKCVKSCDSLKNADW
jgi:hypothetical protein